MGAEPGSSEQEGMGEARTTLAGGIESPIVAHQAENPTLFNELGQRLTDRTALVRTRMPGGVRGKARKGYPIPIFTIISKAVLGDLAFAKLTHATSLSEWHRWSERKRVVLDNF